MSHAHAIFPTFQATRGGFNRSPTLFIGPSRYGTLEVIAIVTPPADVHIFHVMALRESTRKVSTTRKETSHDQRPDHPNEGRD
jgi:hypothetical protein